jgi:hypothetical protein
LPKFERTRLLRACGHNPSFADELLFVLNADHRAPRRYCSIVDPRGDSGGHCHRGRLVVGEAVSGTTMVAMALVISGGGLASGALALLAKRTA